MTTEQTTPNTKLKSSSASLKKEKVKTIKTIGEEDDLLDDSPQSTSSPRVRKKKDFEGVYKIGIVYHTVSLWTIKKKVEEYTNPVQDSIIRAFAAGISEAGGTPVVMKITFDKNEKIVSPSPTQEALLECAGIIMCCQNNSGLPDYLTLKFVTQEMSVDPNHQVFVDIPCYCWVHTGVSEGGGREAGNALLSVLANQGMVRLGVSKYFRSVNGLIVRGKMKDNPEEYREYVARRVEEAGIHGHNLTLVAKHPPVGFRDLAGSAGGPIGLQSLHDLETTYPTLDTGRLKQFDDVNTCDAGGGGSGVGVCLGTAGMPAGQPTVTPLDLVREFVHTTVLEKVVGLQWRDCHSRNPRFTALPMGIQKQLEAHCAAARLHS